MLIRRFRLFDGPEHNIGLFLPEEWTFDPENGCFSGSGHCGREPEPEIRHKSIEQPIHELHADSARHHQNAQCDTHGSMDGTFRRFHRDGNRGCSVPFYGLHPNQHNSHFYIFFVYALVCNLLKSCRIQNDANLLATIPRMSNGVKMDDVRKFCVAMI